tara:strand:- start:232 stop:570 length:339 start_codon:yes stop_codon:yes gene_type:complete
MEKYHTILSFGILLSNGADVQEDSKQEKHSAVKSAFSQKYPAAKKVDLDLKFATERGVEFKRCDSKYSAGFLIDASFRNTEYLHNAEENKASYQNTYSYDTKVIQIRYSNKF